MASAPTSPVLEDAYVCIERLNRECFCITLDLDALCWAFEREAGDPDFCAQYVRTPAPAVPASAGLTTGRT
jgi:hypothetical protein